jgi:biopolymer transport protein ExbD
MAGRFSHHLLEQGDSAEIDMTPMLDVVFIMLIFFIVSTSFIKETGITVNRPSAQTAEIQEQTSLLVAIKPNGDIWINKRLVDIRSVRSNIERLLVESPEAGVVIQADTDARTGTLIKVMDQLRMAGVEDISIAADSQL